MHFHNFLAYPIERHGEISISIFSYTASSFWSFFRGCLQRNACLLQWVCGKLHFVIILKCNCLSYTSVALSLAWTVNFLEHKLVFIRFCRGCVRYCHHNTSCYRAEDFWAIKCGVARDLQGDVTWEWSGGYSSTCFPQGLSAKILTTLLPTVSARWWKCTDYSCRMGRSEEVLKVDPYLTFCCLEWNQGFQSLPQW